MNENNGINPPDNINPINHFNRPDDFASHGHEESVSDDTVRETVAEQWPVQNSAGDTVKEDFSEAAQETSEYASAQETVGETLYNETTKDNTYYTEQEDTVKNDSYYSNSDTPVYPNATPFVHASVKPAKKKRYISVPAAIIALICTAVVSIAGGAFVSNLPIMGGDNGSNKPAYNKQATVQDNIKQSTTISGAQTAGVDKINGQPLTTPEVVDLVGPAVVGVINKTTYGDAYGYYGSLFGNLDEEVEQSSGSGVIISSDGYVVTNNHVVESATALTVILSSGEEYDAKVIGKDPSTDLAVLKIEATDLVYAQMGVSSSLRVGETAIAIGNPLGQEFAGTTTQGVISGLNRSVTIGDTTMNLIQTDAAINPGNSGGALVNVYGQLIGINTAKISSETLEGLGFAIPIDEAKPIIQDLMTNGFVKGRPVIGIAGRAVTKKDAEAYGMKVGVYVSSITPNGPAYMSGVKIGDIIVECEGKPIETVDDINAIKNEMAPGDELKMKVYRKGDYVDITIVLGEDNPTAN